MATTSPTNSRFSPMLRLLRNFTERMRTSSTTSTSPELKLAIAFLTPWALLGTAICRYTWAVSILRRLSTQVTNSFYASVSIPITHPMYRQVLAYMEEGGSGKRARTLALSTLTQTGNPGELSAATLAAYGYSAGLGYQNRAAVEAAKLKHILAESSAPQPLSYVPDVGKYVFWHKWHRMTFTRTSPAEAVMDKKWRIVTRATSGGVEISCLSLFAGAQPIKDWLHMINTTPVEDLTTTIYRPDVTNLVWDGGITRPSRNLNAVTLKAEVKDDLIQDITTYLSTATRRYYANRGIPWMRGFLFFGNPGCGKTSLVNAIAGHFRLNVYMFSLSTPTLTDSVLEKLFEQLPSRCIVLLEDIDSVGLQREPKKRLKKKHPRFQSRSYAPVPGQPLLMSDYEEEVISTGVTLSGLLNVLDGIHSKEGMLTIMTSNTPDNLDPALVRPGRIDRKILFGYCSKEVLAKLFRHIFERAPEEVAEDEGPADRSDIPQLAARFAGKVPEDKLTPAEIQGYLLVHRKDPVAAVAGVEEWAKSTIERKALGVIVDKFASEIPVKKKKGTIKESAPAEKASLDALTDLIADSKISSASPNGKASPQISDFIELLKLGRGLDAATQASMRDTMTG